MIRANDVVRITWVKKSHRTIPAWWHSTRPNP